MEREEFVEEVQLNILRNHAIRLSETETWKAIRATMQTLAEQLTPNETAFLATKLPLEVGDLLEPEESDQGFTLEEFFERVAEQAAVDMVVASYYVRGVLETVSEALSHEEVAQLQRKLPARFSPLFERGESDGLGISL